MPKPITVEECLAEVASHREQLGLQFLTLNAKLAQRLDQYWPMQQYRAVEGLLACHQRLKDEIGDCPGSAASIALESMPVLSPDSQAFAYFSPALKFINSLENQADKVRPAVQLLSADLGDAKNESVEYGRELLKKHIEMQMQWIALQDHPWWRFHHNFNEYRPWSQFIVEAVISNEKAMWVLRREISSAQWTKLSDESSEMLDKLLAAVQDREPGISPEEAQLRMATRPPPLLKPEVLREEQLQHMEYERDEAQAHLLDVSLNLLVMEIQYGQVPTLQDFQSNAVDFWWGLRQTEEPHALTQRPFNVALVGVAEM